MTRCPNCFTPVPGPARPQPSTGEAPRTSRRGSIPPEPPASPPPRPQNCATCKKPYPPGWLSCGTTCIVMAGATGTGKSIYLAVMYKQLEQFASRKGMDVSPATPAVRAVLDEHYLNPLYVERGVMAATPPSITNRAYQRESLVFTLTRPPKGPGEHDVTHNIVIRDVAGEDLEHPEQIAGEYAGYFANADCVFFLFDPLRVQEIRMRLRGLVAEQELGGEPKQVLQTTLSLVERGTPKLAMIMSKFDTMQALRQVRTGGEWTDIMSNAGAAFLRDPGPIVSPDDPEGILLHEEVRSLLLLLEQGALVSRLESAGRRFGYYRFFAVSALGDAPRGTSLSVRGIAPFRCLDPLFWAMDGNGVLR